MCYLLSHLGRWRQTDYISGMTFLFPSTNLQWAKTQFLPLLALMITLPQAMVSQATEPDDPAWRRFQHALGEPAAIGVNASHSMADAITRPIPAIKPDDINAGKFLLGNDLFHENLLSSDGTAACISCHAGPISGTDGRPVPLGVSRAMGRFNALTTFNTLYSFRQFWDGRSITLADQAIEPVISELEFASTRDAALSFLQNDDQYVEAFETIYPDGVSLENMQDALAHFQAINFAVTNSPFQQYLRTQLQPNGHSASGSETRAITEEALQGWETFQRVGCTQCHNGINLGGNSYQRLGTLLPYYPEVREADMNDEGLAERSGRAKDRHFFKVPGLHNVAMTPPYYHDGSESSLRTVIQEMGRFQLARELSPREVEDIASFLKSLTGRPYGLTHWQQINELVTTRKHPNSDTATAAGTSHRQAYLEAARALRPSFQLLQNEMRQVSRGKTPHFDFLQFQHRELIRLARALRHPPADTEAEVQRCLQPVTGKLLQQVLALEWLIADFLSAQATLGILAINTEIMDTTNETALLTANADKDNLEEIRSESLTAVTSSEIGQLTGMLLDCTL